MTLDDIYKEWSNDSHFDETQLTYISLATPKFKNKYGRMRSDIKREMAVLEGHKNRFYEFLHRYYTDNSNVHDDELETYGYAIRDEKNVLRTDADRIISADKKWNKIVLEYNDLKIKLETVEEIMKDLNNRSFYISNAIRDREFLSGMR